MLSRVIFRHALLILADQPTARRFDAPDFAVKITYVFGIRIYFQDRARMARLSLHYLLQSEKNISPCGCQRADDAWDQDRGQAGLVSMSDDVGLMCVRRSFSNAVPRPGAGEGGSW